MMISYAREYISYAFKYDFFMPEDAFYQKLLKHSLIVLFSPLLLMCLMEHYQIKMLS